MESRKESEWSDVCVCVSVLGSGCVHMLHVYMCMYMYIHMFCSRQSVFFCCLVYSKESVLQHMLMYMNMFLQSNNVIGRDINLLIQEWLLKKPIARGMDVYVHANGCYYAFSLCFLD